MKKVPAHHLSNRPSQAQKADRKSKRAAAMDTATSRLNPWLEPPEDVTSSASLARPRIRITAKHRAWLDQYKIQGYSDPNGAAREVGLTRHGIGTQLVLRLTHEIAAMRLADQL